MGGQGNFSDSWLGIDVKHSPDMVTSKLPALRAYQLSLPGGTSTRPAALMQPSLSADAPSSIGRARATTSPGSALITTLGQLHAPAETGVDGVYAARTANDAYRTTPLRALWQRAPYFHDGSAASLADVVAHYNRVRRLGLTAGQQRDLGLII